MEQEKSDVISSLDRKSIVRFYYLKSQLVSGQWSPFLASYCGL